MKKLLDKGFIFLGIGLIAMLVELVVLNGFLNQLNVLTYLLAVGIIPAAILFVGLLLFGANTKIPGKFTYVAALVMALIFSGIMLLYCSAAITPELMDTIVANSMTSSTTEVSMTTASAGDNIQSILIFVAFAGIGAFIGNRIRRKKNPTHTATVKDEYDD